jgi:hypothetical protein
MKPTGGPGRPRSISLENIAWSSRGSGAPAQAKRKPKPAAAP